MKRTVNITRAAYAVLAEIDASLPKADLNPDQTVDCSVLSVLYDGLIVEQREHGHATISDTIIHMYTHIRLPDPKKPDWWGEGAE